jgi:hypothetical protein
MGFRTCVVSVSVIESKTLNNLLNEKLVELMEPLPILDETEGVCHLSQSLFEPENERYSLSLKSIRKKY